MNEPHDELLEIAGQQSRLALAVDDAKVAGPVGALEGAATRAGKAFSGSWWGYHATVYYRDFRPPPAGARFSIEWGLIAEVNDGTIGDWQEYSEDDVTTAIHRFAGQPDTGPAEALLKEVAPTFETDKAEVLSILVTELAHAADPYLEQLKQDAEKLKFARAGDFIAAWRPHGKFISHDSTAISAGPRTPPHFAVLATCLYLKQPKYLCAQLSGVARKAGSHLARKSKQRRKSELVGTNVFIGHGRSLVWRELKDFIEGTLRLPSDEFNRVPAAGVTNIARLSEMLDAAAFAFLVMTGEDETPDGTLRARMNVVHEAGLFQGRLGFGKAIVLLEEGCEEFSNIQGLGQIRFPKGNVRAAFEDIRQVLAREGLIADPA
jgi:predicted nucleotide-binding protein